MASAARSIANDDLGAGLLRPQLRSAAQPLNKFFGLLSDEQKAQINALL